MKKEKSKKQINLEIKRLKQYVKKNLPDNWDKIDTEAEYNSGISYKENKEHLAEIIKQNLPLKDILNNLATKSYFKEQLEREKHEQKERIKQEEEQVLKAVEEHNKNIKCENEAIKKHYSRLRRTIELVVGGYITSCFIQGKAGTGKSFQITSMLNELNLEQEKDYIIFQGDITPAFIFRFLYENNGKIIIFRDLAKLLSELRSIDILKAVTETTGKRIVRKANYSKEQEDLPNQFICESKLIFEFNDLSFNNGLKEDVEALLSRGDYYNLVLSFNEIEDIMRNICENKEQKEVTEYLLQNYNYIGINSLNLRTQQKAFKIYEWSKKNKKEWKRELKLFLSSEMSHIRRQLYSLIGNKAISTKELKKLLIRGRIDNVSHLRTADRRVREWVLLNELFIVGFVTNDDEELEKYMDTHRNYYVSLNPIEKIELDDTIVNSNQNKIMGMKMSSKIEITQKDFEEANKK